VAATGSRDNLGEVVSHLAVLQQAAAAVCLWVVHSNAYGGATQHDTAWAASWHGWASLQWKINHWYHDRLL